MALFAWTRCFYHDFMIHAGMEFNGVNCITDRIFAFGTVYGILGRTK